MTNSNQATDTQNIYTVDLAAYTHNNSELSSAVKVLLTRIEALEAEVQSLKGGN